MRVAAHQPNYLPNLGFFYKMAKADLFVLITNIQFEKHEGWQQRHKIPGPAGDLWLTVPVLGSQHQLIKEVKINNNLDWRRKHKKTMGTLYAATGEKNLLPILLALYDAPWERLVDLNVAVIKALREILGIKTPFVVDEEVSGRKQELLINICKKYGARGYLSGLGAKDYLREDYFTALERKNITHHFVDKNLTAGYPYSTVHYLLREGKEKVRELLEIS